MTMTGSFFMVNVGKYISPMDAMGYLHDFQGSID